MKENSDPKLTLISKLFMAELGFFKSLKLHFDICNILIYNKMSIKWTDLHCRLLLLHFVCIPAIVAFSVCTLENISL